MCDGALASNRQVSTVEGSRDQTSNLSSSSQVFDQRRVFQPKPLRNLLSSSLAGNLLRNTRRNVQNSNPELQRRRNVPQGLVQNGRRTFGDRTMWLGRRYFSADAHLNSECKKKGLSESQIGQELLSEIEEQPSTGLQACLNLVYSFVLRSQILHQSCARSKGSS